MPDLDRCPRCGARPVWHKTNPVLEFLWGVRYFSFHVIAVPFRASSALLRWVAEAFERLGGKP